ncbi:MAG: SGNH/GDSL hydrolase family protein [Clostridia bacterium]|nr:SGNH/GDSL hydrolase family protein [Clostridia bacterium]MBQ9921124.1 SGNH/GDSL hydrolase family protein [Clostridia bacterium]
MNIYDIIPDPAEKPLDRLVEGYSNTSIFRKMAFIGDSLSSGEFETHVEGKNVGYYDMFEHSWGQYIARRNGCTAYNFSCGGMTAKSFDSFADWHLMWSRDKAAQAYVIALGVNDIYNGAVENFGTIDDVNVTDYKSNAPTFMGYYGAIISKYKEITPDAKFFLVTFPNDPMADAAVTRQMADGLYQLAEKFDNCYVIDLYRYGPVYDEEFRKHYFYHSHMSPAGYIFTAKLIDSYIDYIIRHNPDDFKTAGFIGTGIAY